MANTYRGGCLGPVLKCVTATNQLRGGQRNFEQYAAKASSMVRESGPII